MMLKLLLIKMSFHLLIFSSSNTNKLVDKLIAFSRKTPVLLPIVPPLVQLTLMQKWLSLQVIQLQVNTRLILKRASLVDTSLIVVCFVNQNPFQLALDFDLTWLVRSIVIKQNL